MKLVYILLLLGSSAHALELKTAPPKPEKTYQVDGKETSSTEALRAAMAGKKVYQCSEFEAVESKGTIKLKKK